MTDKRNKKTITSTETDKEVVERVYHLKEIKKLLDEVLEDYINQVAVMNDKELSYDRSEWMKTIGREKYDDEELERHSQIHTVSIELEQIRRFGGIVYDYEE
jgi:nuclear transport factor 2 (NTF2) superfamily protein